MEFRPFEAFPEKPGGPPSISFLGVPPLIHLLFQILPIQRLIAPHREGCVFFFREPKLPPLKRSICSENELVWKAPFRSGMHLAVWPTSFSMSSKEPCLEDLLSRGNFFFSLPRRIQGHDLWFRFFYPQSSRSRRHLQLVSEGFCILNPSDGFGLGLF